MTVTVIFMIFVTVVMAFVSRMRVSRMVMPFLLMAAKMPVIVMIMIVPFLYITVLMGGMSVLFVVMLMTFMPTMLVSLMSVIMCPVAAVVVSAVIMHMTLLLAGFFYFVYQGFRLIWFRLIHPGKTAQALPDGGQCGLKKIFFQRNVYIRVRQWVKMFRPGQHQHPWAWHLGVNNSGLFCHARVRITNNQQNISFSWIGGQSCFSIQRL